MPLFVVFPRIEFQTIEFYNSRFFVDECVGGIRSHNAILDGDCRAGVEREQLFDDGMPVQSSSSDLFGEVTTAM